MQLEPNCRRSFGGGPVFRSGPPELTDGSSYKAGLENRLDPMGMVHQKAKGNSDRRLSRWNGLLLLSRQAIDA